MLNAILPITIGKPNKDGLREVTIRDGTGNNKVIEADKERLDEFLKEKERILNSGQTKMVIGELLGLAAGFIIAALTKTKKPFAWFGAIFGGTLAGLFAAIGIYRKQLQTDYQKAVGKLESEVKK